MVTPLGLTNVDARSMRRGFRSKDEVIVTYRFILVLAGSIDYWVETGVIRLDAGVQVLVPAWTRRRWSVPRAGGCSIIWTEFAAEALAEDLGGPLMAEGADRALEEASLRRMLALWHYGRLPYETTGLAADEGTRAPEQDRLELESELKAALARFWRRARPAPGWASGFVPAERRHPEVTRALRWLHANYAQPEALNEFYRHLEGNPTHFRTLFRRDTQSNVQEHLARLRLRRARFLLRHTSWPLKRISYEVGYRDAAYFSRHYKAFWGHAPTAEERI